jgi:hypothetical protein
MRIKKIDLHLLNMQTRLPFKYGMTTLTALPHMFVRMEAEVDGVNTVGISADGLAPKWFSKDPNTSIEEDLIEMIGMIKNAKDIVLEIAEGDSVFSIWQELYKKQKAWGDENNLAPLLSGFGSSLMERAMISCYCQATGKNFHECLMDNSLGIDLSAIYPELAGKEPKDSLKPAASSTLRLRHTVGLVDPLYTSELSDDDKPEDSLPRSLEENIKAYGLNCFKIKVCGDFEGDLKRLVTIAEILDASGLEYSYTFDGNEQFGSMAEFREFWELLVAEEKLANFLKRLIFVEQPVYRTAALGEETKDCFDNWPEAPIMIIDESDGEVRSMKKAIDLGYSGTSHKNCKGVFKSIANLALIQHLTSEDKPLVLSAEDLTNVGPVALLQDLAVVASLGIQHVERNGHHYFKGLSMYPEAVQETFIKAIPNLYHRVDDFAALKVEKGVIDTSSITETALGLDAALLDTRQFTPVDDWEFSSLGLEE